MPVMSREQARLTAILRGSCFPNEPFPFVIHSIFPSAINISKENDELLSSFVLKKATMHPRAVLVRAEDQAIVDFTRLSLVPGMQGYADADGFHIRSELFIQYAPDLTALSSSQISIEVSDLHHDWPRLGEYCFAQLSALQKQKNADLDIQTLVGGEAEAALPACTPFDARQRALLIKSIQNLGKAMWQADAKSALRHACRLIGLGQGLTPAGDDFLTGFSYALMCRQQIAEDKQSLAASEFLNGLKNRLRNEPGQTNDISRTFLLLSLSGEASEALKRLASAFEDGFSRQQFEFALQVLAGIGHSSGLDAACGFIYGVFQNDRAFSKSLRTFANSQQCRL